MADLSNPIHAQRSANPSIQREIRPHPGDWRTARTVGKYTVRPVQRSEIHAAVRIVLGQADASADDAAVLDFLRFAVARRIDLGQMQVVADEQTLRFATAPIRSPGGSAIISCTTRPTPDLADAAEVALARTCEALAEAGLALAQTLLDPDDAALAAVMRKAGFAPMATLSYLLRSVPGKVPWPKLPNGLALEPYTESAYTRFRDLVSATYVQSLDCPALSGMRSMDDVMAGHRAAGEFVPALWQMLCHEGRPVGVVLLAKVLDRPLAEVVYLGLIPEARGKGWSDLLVKAALAEAREQQCDGLTLAVDADNAPALRLYHRHGLQQIYRRDAWMKQL